jgi:hypothetical protein
MSKVKLTYGLVANPSAKSTVRDANLCTRTRPRVMYRRLVYGSCPTLSYIEFIRLSVYLFVYLSGATYLTNVQSLIWTLREREDCHRLERCGMMVWAMRDDGGEMKGGKSGESTLLYHVTLHSPGKEVEEHEYQVSGPNTWWVSESKHVLGQWTAYHSWWVQRDWVQKRARGT